MSAPSTAVIEQDALQAVTLGKFFRVTSQGLTVIGTPGIDDFAALGETFRTLDRALQFSIGDFFRECEDRFGEAASQILDHTGWSAETLRAYRWTAQSVLPENRRMDVLTYSHHQAIAKLPPQEQRRWLKRAATPNPETGERWSVSRLKQELKHADTAPEHKRYGVTVWCDSEADQEACCRQLENLGRTYRTFVSGKGDGK